MDLGGSAFTLAVNLSARQLRDPNLSATVHEALPATASAPGSSAWN